MGRSRGNADEASLVADFVAGSEESFEVLIGRYSQVLFSSALYLTNSLDLAETILVEVFYRAYAELPWAKKEAGIRAWLFQLTFEVACEKMGFAKDELPIEKSFGEDVQTNVLFDAKQLVSFSRELVLDAVGQLALLEKAVFIYADIVGLSAHEVATALDESETTVRSLQHAARRKIIQLIKRSPKGITKNSQQISLTKLEPLVGTPGLHT